MPKQMDKPITTFTPIHIYNISQVSNGSSLVHGAVVVNDEKVKVSFFLPQPPDFWIPLGNVFLHSMETHPYVFSTSRTGKPGGVRLVQNGKYINLEPYPKSYTLRLINPDLAFHPSLGAIERLAAFGNLLVIALITL